MKLSLSKEGIDFIKKEKIKLISELKQNNLLMSNDSSGSKEEKNPRNSYFLKKSTSKTFMRKSTLGHILSKTPGPTRFERVNGPNPASVISLTSAKELDVNRNSKKVNSAIIHKRKYMNLYAIPSSPGFKFSSYMINRTSKVERLNKYDGSTFVEFQDSYDNYTPQFELSKERLKVVKEKANEKKNLKKIYKEMKKLVDSKNLNVKYTLDKLKNEENVRTHNKFTKVDSKVKKFNEAITKKKLDFTKYNDEIRKIQQLKKIENKHKKSNSMFSLRKGQIKSIADIKRFEILRIHPKSVLDKEVKELRKEFKEITMSNTDKNLRRYTRRSMPSSEKKRKERLEKLQKSTGHLRLKELKRYGNLSATYLIDSNALPGCFRARRRSRRQNSMRLTE